MKETIKKMGKSIVTCFLMILSFVIVGASKVSAAGAYGGEDAYYLVSAIDENKAVDICCGSTYSEANVQLYDANQTGAQQFVFIYQENGYYVIANVNSGKVLDCQGGGTTCGTNVWQYEYNATDAQMWKLIPLGSDYYYIQAKCGLYLDVSGGSTENGTNIQLYTGNRTLAQVFKLVPHIKYTYQTVEFDCSSLDAWKSSVVSTNYSVNGCIVSQNVVSYKTIYIKQPVHGPNNSQYNSYRTVELKLPHIVEYKVHTHEYNVGFGKSFYYTNNGIQCVQTCNCGYRQETTFWEIPDLTEMSSSQTSQTVINNLPSFK